MKKLILIIAIVLAYGCKNTSEEKTETTTYYFVRHAEKDIEPLKNPKLLPSGIRRANNFASFFKDIPLDAVYSTNFTRTRNTALPTAKAKNLETIIYSPFKMDYLDFKTKTKEKSVFIVGHSNTIPNFVNQIIGSETYQDMDESVYSNMYIVTITNGKISHELKTLN